MAVNGINSPIRMNGMVSGIDTDTLVKQLMAADQAKIDKVIQKRDIDVWKTDAYRDITSSLQTFYNDYFDTLSANNLKSADNFACFSATYGTDKSSDFVTVTPGADAKAGTYSISEMIKATKATLSSGSSASGNVLGAAIGDSVDISSANNNNIFAITFNGVSKNIVLPDFSGNLDGNYLAKIQGVIDGAFGSGKISVSTNPPPALPTDPPLAGSKIQLSTVRSTDSFSIGTAFNNGADDIFSAVPTTKTPFTINSSNNKFDLKIGGKKVTVALPLNGQTKFTSANDLANAIQTAANAAISDYNTKNPLDTITDSVTFSVSSGKVKYSSTTSVSVSETEIDANATLKFDPKITSLSNKVDLKAKIADIAGTFAGALSLSGSGSDIQFSINGKRFTFDSRTTSLNDIMNKVNSDTTIGATMSYDYTTNSFKVESNSTGVTSKLTLKDVTGGLFGALGIDTSKTAAGTDASVKLSGVNGSSDTIEIIRSTNTFTYDGLSFDIKDDFKSDATTDPIKVTVASDTSNTYDYIKTFVDKYNELIDKLNTKISEKRDNDYVPLTEEQKAAMTADQIDKWETKAKTGLLKNDSIISGVLDKLRSALYNTVEGAGISLTSIGITTSSSYTDKGKLVINETNLKKALANNPDKVAKLFTSDSDVSYYDTLENPSLRSQRNKETGIAQRFSDVIQDAIRTNTDSGGQKGSLLEKAGIVGDRSEYSNILAKEIMDYDNMATDMNSKLVDKQNALYSKFSKMETALSQLNSQQSWLAQQFGGGR